MRHSMYAPALTHMDMHTQGLRYKYTDKPIHSEWLEKLLLVSIASVVAVLAASSHDCTGKCGSFAEHTGLFLREHIRPV